MDIMDKGVRIETDELKRIITGVKTYGGEEREFHGETGTTYGGSGYSPMVRSVYFPSVGAKHLSVNGVHSRDGKGSKV